MIVARSPHDDSPVAAYHSGWRAGGDVWVAPDEWSSLRFRPLARDASWRLESDDGEILRLRPVGDDGSFELGMYRMSANSALQILLVCEAIETERALGDAALLRSM